MRLKVESFRPGIIPLLAALVISGAGIVRVRGAMPAEPILERSNWRESDLPVDGLTRWYRVYLPSNLALESPVVVLLHGGRQSMKRIFAPEAVAPSRWADLAEQEGFLLVVPNGMDSTGQDGRGDRQGWNDGRVPDAPRPVEVDDVAFIKSLLDRVARDYSIDPSRVYVTGASNGGMMTFRLLIEAPERFAAGAAYIANLPVDWPTLRKPDLPTPLMIANGTKDPVVKWAGGEILEGLGHVRSAEATVAWWVEVNRADSKNPVSESLPDADPTDPCRVLRTTYAAGPGGAPVVFYTLEGMGHSMPSRKLEIPESFPTRPVCRDVEGADLAWEFLKPHRRVPAG